MSVLTLPARLESTTPASRDRAVDALRALAILGVVLGHWLVTAFVSDGGPLRVASPLSSQPSLVPVSWLLQTLAVFFLVGGYAGARSLDSARRSGRAYRSWLLTRLVRLGLPVLALLVFWVVAGPVLVSAGMPAESLPPLQRIVISPLWFLAVYAALTACTPLVLACCSAAGWRRTVMTLVAVVAAVDLVRFGASGPAWLGWVNLLAGWLVPYCLGAAWALGARPRPVPLLVGGTAATLVLVHWFGYPSSMVGVPGDGRSNLNPPTLAAVAFGLAQVGLVLLLRAPLTRLARRPPVWAAVVLVNLSAMTIFLWHQTALIAVTTFGLGFGRLPGLHTAPDGPVWVLARLAWLPAFATMLAVFVALFHPFEDARRPGLRSVRRPALVQPAATGATAASVRRIRSAGESST